MNRNRFAYILILTAALNFSACGGAAESAGGDNKAAAATPSANAATNPTPATAAVNANTGAVSNANTGAASAETVAATPAPVGDAAAARQATPAASPSRASGSTPTAKAPAPQIGSGGNDFFLFTQARAALNNDPELKAANLVVEVKEGVVTLSGAVASAALKSKAEQLARGAGSKSVRNQLRVVAAR